jgi:hypothetical protein
LTITICAQYCHRILQRHSPARTAASPIQYFVEGRLAGFVVLDARHGAIMALLAVRKEICSPGLRALGDS